MSLSEERLFMSLPTPFTNLRLLLSQQKPTNMSRLTVRYNRTMEDTNPSVDVMTGGSVTLPQSKLADFIKTVKEHYNTGGCSADNETETVRKTQPIVIQTVGSTFTAEEVPEGTLVNVEVVTAATT